MTKRYTKWVPSRKKAGRLRDRLDRTTKGAAATSMDGFVAGYKTGYIVTSRKKIRGWKLKNLPKMERFR